MEACVGQPQIFTLCQIVCREQVFSSHVVIEHLKLTHVEHMSSCFEDKFRLSNTLSKFAGLTILSVIRDWITKPFTLRIVFAPQQLLI